MLDVNQCQRKSPKKALNFPAILRSFVGYLEGTNKARHTITSYRSDLGTFEKFLETGLGEKSVALHQLRREDLDRYSEYLRVQGLKTNTRRRKILTVRRLLKFLNQRKKLAVDWSGQIPAPHKFEKVPQVVESEVLITRIRSLPEDTQLLKRNRVLLWTLAETGCLVSEVGYLKKDDFVLRPDGKGEVRIPGKAARPVPVSAELIQAAQDLGVSSAHPSTGSLFQGYNKYGPMGGSITSRGVELLVRAAAVQLQFPHITPRLFRHSAVLRWAREGCHRDEIQKRLGLKTDYAFRGYGPLLKKVQKQSAKKKPQLDLELE